MGFNDASRATALRPGGAPVTERSGRPAVDEWAHVAEVSAGARARVMPSIAGRPQAGGATNRRRPAGRRRTRGRFPMRLGSPDRWITFQGTLGVGRRPLGAPRSTVRCPRPARNTGRTPSQNIWGRSGTRRAEGRLNAPYPHGSLHCVPDVCWRSVQWDGTVAGSVAFAVAGGRVLLPTTDFDGRLAAPVFAWADVGA